MYNSQFPFNSYTYTYQYKYNSNPYMVDPMLMMNGWNPEFSSNSQLQIPSPYFNYYQPLPFMMGNQ